MTGASLGTDLPGRVVRDALPVRGNGGPSAGGVLHPGVLCTAPGCHLPSRCLQTRGAATRGGEILLVIRAREGEAGGVNYTGDQLIL